MCNEANSGYSSKFINHSMSAKKSQNNKKNKVKATVPKTCFIALLVKHLFMEASFHRFITVPKTLLPLQFDHPQPHCCVSSQL